MAMKMRKSHALKKKPCRDGRKFLDAQMKIFLCTSETENPFVAPEIAENNEEENNEEEVFIVIEAFNNEDIRVD